MSSISSSTLLWQRKHTGDVNISGTCLTLLLFVASTATIHAWYTLPCAKALLFSEKDFCRGDLGELQMGSSSRLCCAFYWLLIISTAIVRLCILVSLIIRATMFCSSQAYRLEDIRAENNMYKIKHQPDIDELLRAEEQDPSPQRDLEDRTSYTSRPFFWGYQYLPTLDMH